MKPGGGTPFLIFGHRGDAGREQENTLPSFRSALEAGADGFETDLRRTRDGVVLFHNRNVGRTPIATLRSAELRRRVGDLARLEELAAFRGRCRMILEIKEPGLEEALLRVAGDWPGVVVCSFDHTIIRGLSRKDPPFDLGLTVREYRPDLVDRFRSWGVRWFFPRWNQVDEVLVRSCRAADVAVVPWSPNRVGTWRALQEWGCSGMITDRIERAVLWRDGKPI